MAGWRQSAHSSSSQNTGSGAPLAPTVSSPIVRLSLWLWELPQHPSYEPFLLAKVGLSPFLLLKTQET